MQCKTRREITSSRWRIRTPPTIRHEFPSDSTYPYRTHQQHQSSRLHRNRRFHIFNIRRFNCLYLGRYFSNCNQHSHRSHRLRNTPHHKLTPGASSSNNHLESKHIRNRLIRSNREIMGSPLLKINNDALPQLSNRIPLNPSYRHSTHLRRLKPNEDMGHSLWRTPHLNPIKPSKNNHFNDIQLRLFANPHCFFRRSCKDI